MPRKDSNKRQRLIQSAKLLMHKKGFNFTTLADIAQEADVPLGNVYYYFKTKEAIGEAVISSRAAELNERLANWENDPNAASRLFNLVQYELDEMNTTVQYGCPVGSLCQELAKQGGNLAEIASNLLKTQIEWAEKQFESFGWDKNKANDFALQLVSNIQGMCLLTNTYKDLSYAHKISENLKSWIQKVAQKSKEEAFA